jgi:hypothetical protein
MAAPLDCRARGAYDATDADCCADDGAWGGVALDCTAAADAAASMTGCCAVWVMGAASLRALLLLLDALGSNPVTAAVAAKLAMMTPTAAVATNG